MLLDYMYVRFVTLICFLLQQVELMPGSGVYIKRATYNQLQFIDKGSKLVRKLVREIFPDVHLLASSSCMGKGESSAGLDRHKVEVIKGASFGARLFHFFVCQSWKFSETIVLDLAMVNSIVGTCV